MIRLLLFLLPTVLAQTATFELTDKVTVQWLIQSTFAFMLRVTCPNHYYVAFSFGGTHINSDMVVFKANGTASTFYDMYSYGYGEPLLDTRYNSYSGTASYTAATDSVYFQVTRYLNTADPQDYVVQRDWPNRIGWAVREYDSDTIGNATTWVGNLGDHHKVGYFNLYLWSNGTTTF